MEEHKQVNYKSKISRAVQIEDLRQHQVEMIQRYRIPGVLEVTVEKEGHVTYLSYDVSGMVTLEVYLKDRMVSTSEAIRMLREVLLTLEEAKAYYLEPEDFMLTSGQVYVTEQNGRVALMPYPVRSGETGQWFLFIQRLITEHMWVEPDFPWAELMDGLRQSDRKIKECLTTVRSLEMGVINQFGQVNGQIAGQLNGGRESEATAGGYTTVSYIARAKRLLQKIMSVKDRLSEGDRNGKAIAHRGQAQSDGQKPLKETDETQLLIQEESCLELADGRTVPLRSNEMFIGRQEELVQILLDDVAVGRVHCVCKRMGDKWFIVDLHSTNGTQVNGQTLQAGVSMALTSGDHIRIGNVLMTYRTIG